MNKKVINNWNCYILDNRTDDNPVMIYWGISKDNEEYIGNIYNHLEKCINSKYSYIIITYEVPDWNSYFSPWLYEMNEKNVFMGYGNKTLQWLSKSISIIEEIYHIQYSIENRYLIGYSLSGLFSLWAFYGSQLFNGVASCSGSLWFPEWKDYVEKSNIRKESKVYLSLGKKEEKSSNSIMKKVGEITRWQFNKLDKNVDNIKLEWQDGGHFNNIDKRIISAIKWLLES